MFLLVVCQHVSGMCQSHFCLVLSLLKVPRKYVELSPNTPPFLTLQFREKDLTPTPNLHQIRLIPPPLGHILSHQKALQHLCSGVGVVRHDSYGPNQCISNDLTTRLSVHHGGHSSGCKLYLLQNNEKQNQGQDDHCLPKNG
jgi:hypothetical protein